MTKPNRISWLASYPKSGNTWMRCLLRAYQFDAYEPININQIGRISQSDSRRSDFESVLNPATSGLTEPEVNAARKHVQRQIAANLGQYQVVKTHNARVIVDGFPVICDELTARAVYIVRNPLDIVDSLADHCNLSLDAAIAALANTNYTFGAADTKFIRQYLNSWSNHVRSWIDGTPYPVHVVRYEDLLEHPEQNFAQTLEFLGWPIQVDRVKRAVALTRIEVLQASEQHEGFREVSDIAKSGKFFRRGQAGSWRQLLTDVQIQSVCNSHAAIMQRLGYSAA